VRESVCRSLNDLSLTETVSEPRPQGSGFFANHPTTIQIAGRHGFVNT
jgi:hypothetical protein